MSSACCDGSDARSSSGRSTSRRRDCAGGSGRPSGTRFAAGPPPSAATSPPTASSSTQLLASVHEAHPEVVVRDDAGEYCVAHAAGCSRAPVELLRSFAGDAPFSPWVHAKGLGAGVVLDLVARLRALLPGAEPLPLPARASLPGYANEAEALLRFTRLVAEAQQAERSDLERVRAVFGLSITELGELFGVTRQAAGLWLTDGPPAARRAKAAAVAAIADLLAHRLKPARVPGIARRPAPAYGGRSMLEVIAADEHEWLLESVRRSFDYAATA